MSGTTTTQLKISNAVLSKWQDVLDLTSKSFNISNVFITRVSNSDIELLLKSNSSQKEFKLGVKERLDSSHYGKVFTSDKKLGADDFLLENSNEITYLGYPLKADNGQWFGSLCIVDKNKRKFDSAVKKFFKEFKNMIEEDLSSLKNKKDKALVSLSKDHLLIEEHRLENEKLVEQLIQSERKYKTLFSSTNSAIVIFEAVQNEAGDLVDLIYKDMNPANEKIIEISRENAVGKTLLDLFPNTEPEWIAHFNTVIKDNKNTSFYSYHSDIGKYIYTDSFPLNEKEFVVSAVDLTDKVKLQEKLSEVENRYKNIFYSSSSVMMLISLEDGAIKDVNDEACEFYGYSKRQLQNLKIWDLNIGGQSTAWKNIEKVIKNPRGTCKAKHRTASKEVKEVEVNANIVQFEGKELLHCVVRDVTTRNKNLLKITKLSNAVEQSPVSIVITNLDGDIEYVNPRTCKVTGYEIEELLGKNPRILKSGKQSADVYRDLWGKISSGMKWEGEFFNKTKNGSYYWESASISPVLDEAQKIIGYIKVGLDITEKKNTEAKLTHALLKAEENDRLKSAFLANLSHEVRTPLNGILGFTDFISDEKVTAEERKEYGTIIKDCGNQLMTIMDDILNASLLEAKQLDLNIETVCIDHLLDGIKDLHQLEANRKKLNIQLDHLYNAKLRIQTDKGKLVQVLNNLIQNAIKFTNVGEIIIGCENLKDTVLFYVQDSGIGISPEHQKIIFSRFRQIENHLTREHGGIGLGLSISKQIVEFLGGELWVESDVGRGSKFSFTIPKKIG
ncbi:PAS domain-containing sensor histidine kinase [Marinifilum caeruleilacunae]|uniref:histidine kinase n=1 Tax=Marinifilum caeruleilacunae TaxID=2499076 RepID=A0ABX1WUK7_9BACT|nr:PAS domain S-box protein [Marinifilum caeruleilacunae]NOU59785.1 PAS domain S-box protein [Marinifilum caeruleilacunae]